MGGGPATFYHRNDVMRRDKCAWVRLKWRSAHVFRHSGVLSSSLWKSILQGWGGGGEREEESALKKLEVESM